MDFSTWRQHIERKTDFATRVTHLTRGKDGRTAFQNLMKILSEKRIIGSTTNSGYNVGNRKAVCFQDVPLLSLAENIAYEKEITPDGGVLRYEPYGLRFNKGRLFKQGARPVIYGPTQEMKSKLPPEEYWRIVNMDFINNDNLIDWTHEREWRIPGDLEFEYKDVEVIIYSPDDYREMIEMCMINKPELLKQINGIICLKSILN